MTPLCDLRLFTAPAAFMPPCRYSALPMSLLAAVCRLVPAVSRYALHSVQRCDDLHLTAVRERCRHTACCVPPAFGCSAMGKGHCAVWNSSCVLRTGWVHCLVNNAALPSTVRLYLLSFSAGGIYVRLIM